VLARLDTATLESRIVEAQASLQSAHAKVEEAKATEMEKRAALARCRELAKQRMCSQNDVDAADAAHARARAGVASAEAQVAIAKAVLEGHETNLKKAIIRAPISGVVLDRKVEGGQTVAASLQTPELFTLAEDLSRMELVVAVDEADIGRIREGQQAGFSVDAFPDERFRATITQIRHAPQTVDGVVSYETVLMLDNPNQKLLPGMTATAEIITRRIEDALLLPNAVLRYAPPATPQQEQRGGTLFSRMFRRPRRGRQPQPVIQGKERQVWLLRDGREEAMSITIGESDGIHTEVISGELKPGMALITERIAVRD
jgi:HlyD family secretion protein